MKKICVFLLVQTTMLVFAQGHKFLATPNFNDADLSKQKSLIDPNAPAEYLHKSDHYWLDYQTGLLHHEVFNRIKIYDKEKTTDLHNLEILLYQGDGNAQENLEKMKAYVYNLENGKKVETKVEKSSKFKSKENKYTNVVKYAFPNVNNGSIIEYKYEVISPFAYTVPKVFIDMDIPSLYTEYVLDSPLNVSYNIDYSGASQPKYRELEEKLLYGGNYRTYRFGFENLNGYAKEEFVKNIDNHRTKIKAELHSTLFNNEVKKYSSSWEEIRKSLMQKDDFGGELKKSRLVKDLIPAVAVSATNPEEKANAIFDYVKNAFTWNDYLGVYTENGFKDLLSTKTGNVADINLFLVAMLREAGLEANPMLISTVKNGLINLTIPNLTNCNYVIATVKMGDKLRLYDATVKHSTVNLLPPRAWNSYGILLTSKEAQVLNVINVNMSNTFLNIKAKINNDGSVSGTYTDRDTSLYGMLAKENYQESNESYKKQYKDSYGIDFTDIKSTDFENGDFESTMNFTSNSMIDVIGKKMVINPMIFLNKTKNEFNQAEERRYPIDFLSPYTTTKKIELEIPEGYTIENLPKSKKIVTQDKEISYAYIVENVGNKVVVTSTLKVESAEYPKEYYPAFKQIWKTVVDSQNQVLSLVKK